MARRRLEIGTARVARIAALGGLASIALAGCTAQQGAAPQTTPPAADPRRYVCHRLDTPLVIDGRLDEPAWSKAGWTEEFVDIEGDAKPRPRYATRAAMLWDEHYFYVAAEMKEPHVWGYLTQRDAVIWHENDFEIFIDPNGDTREYYEFEISPQNVIFDLFLVRTYEAGGPAVHLWDCAGLKTGVAIKGTLNDPADVDRAWSVEFAIPWTALREAAGVPCPPRPGHVWRVNFSRVEWRHRIVDGRYEKLPDMREDNWVWSPQGVINMHKPQMWGFVEFAE